MKYYLIFLFIALQQGLNLAATIVVCKTCPVSAIAHAVQLAKNGDEIIIKPGTYKERGILIDKSVRVTGENYPVIDGENLGEVINIIADSVLVQNIVIQNVGSSYLQDRAGIRITRSKHCILNGNKLKNTFFGIYLAHSDSCVIRNNEVQGIPDKESNTGNAIHLWYCRNNLIEGNRLSGHRDGIYFEFVEHSKIYGNTSSDQIRYGLHFMFSHHCDYFRNKFSGNGAGVAVMYSHDISMHENLFSDNWSPVSNGALLKDISDSRIYKNVFEQNTIGLYAEGCHRIEIANNDFIKNGWAVKILGTSENNKFIENNFIANTFEVVTNESRSHNLFEKNFWSDYSGYDLDKDGIGDVPHRPVKLFTYIVENIPPAIILLKSLFIDLLNLAEKVAPVITPETLTDTKPLMKQVQW
ncbi:MAG: nitrous oxide reductase family maturation protein NosD [Bacteroidetes bacterium]|nr:nitrous oxide reductase family maturation protein NosD [Bacteroidota bacterium]